MSLGICARKIAVREELLGRTTTTGLKLRDAAERATVKSTCAVVLAYRCECGEIGQSGGPKKLESPNREPPILVAPK